MYGCESWTIMKAWVLKNGCFWTVVSEKIPESPLDDKETKPVNLKEISPEYALEGLMLKVKLQLWPPDSKSWLLGTRVWCWERLKAGGKGDDRGWDGWMASLKWAPGVGNGQGSLACCSPWGCKESDTTEWLKWTELNQSILTFYYCWRLLSVKGSISVSLNLHFVYLLCNNICFIHFLCLEFFLIIHLLLKLSLCYLEMWYL